MDMFLMSLAKTTKHTNKNNQALWLSSAFFLSLCCLLPPTLLPVRLVRVTADWRPWQKGCYGDWHRGRVWHGGTAQAVQPQRVCVCKCRHVWACMFWLIYLYVHLHAHKIIKVHKSAIIWLDPSRHIQYEYQNLVQIRLGFKTSHNALKMPCIDMFIFTWLVTLSFLW